MLFTVIYNYLLLFPAYKTDMEMDVTRDSSGQFQSLLSQMCKGERVGGSAVDMNEAQRDARELYQVSTCLSLFMYSRYLEV